ncbi:MAG: hypothetical protein KatS3mg022_3190 [Armatimonadota bacterium]|nr:MAG: hypothetical protein KatS3mg022_3190 [Armatimonadota bacterium]
MKYTRKQFYEQIERAEDFIWGSLSPEEARRFAARTTSWLRRKVALSARIPGKDVVAAIEMALRVFQNTGSLDAGAACFQAYCGTREYRPPRIAWFADFEQVCAIVSARGCTLEEAVREFARLRGEPPARVRRRVWRWLRYIAQFPLRQMLAELREMSEDDDEPVAGLLPDGRGGWVAVTDYVLELVFAFYGEAGAS